MPDSPVKDPTYNLIAFLSQALSNVYQLEEYASDAEGDGDNDLAEFFRKAQSDSKKGADQAKQLLGSRLQG